MFQIRIHGRGGQGVVTAAELLSVAAFTEGHHAQAFPSFGSERTGAPVAAFCRIDDRPIRTREPVVAPDFVIIQDATLLGHVDALAGLRPDGGVLVNAPDGVPVIGGALHPTPALLGGFAAATGRLRLESVVAAIRGRFSERVAAGNIAAAREAYEMVRAAKEVSSHA
jgi:pyruvate ferredoxin oxidoreductase gamma subunit